MSVEPGTAHSHQPAYGFHPQACSVCSARPKGPDRLASGLRSQMHCAVMREGPCVLHSLASQVALLWGISREGEILWPAQRMLKTISFALPGLELPQIVRMILVSKGRTLFRSMGTISNACSPVALTMVETTLHRSSKFLWVPCTRSRSVEALLIRFRISGLEKTSLVVRTPAPNERNSVFLGKGLSFGLSVGCLLE